MYSMGKKTKVTILIPTYNGSKTIKETLQSILSQSYKSFEILIHDDASKDDTLRIVHTLKDERIMIRRNRKNVGCQKNMEMARKKINHGIVFFMAQDDILAKNALMETIRAFKKEKDIGFVTRPYYWFDDDIHKPVRATNEVNPKQNETISIRSDYCKIEKVIESIGQISGLAYIAEYADIPIHTDIFTGHAYLFAGILKRKKAVFLKDHTVAVRIRSSQSRSLPGIYEKSPLQSWVDFFNSVFFEKKFAGFRSYFIMNYCAKNYLGLLQIRNYSEYRYVLREIFLLVKYRWKNIYNPSFLLISGLCLLTPRIILISFVDWFKKTIHARSVRKIIFEFSLK